MTSLHPTLAKVTERVIARSQSTRSAYLQRIDGAQGKFPARGALSCANLAHGFAGLEGNDKFSIKAIREPNIGIVSSYNDAVRACAVQGFPRDHQGGRARERRVAQFAGGVPAMCDGVTQGNRGWSCRCSRARRSRWARRSRSRTTCSTRRSASASATRSCRAC